jgi:hypothetical protein
VEPVSNEGLQKRAWVIKKQDPSRGLWRFREVEAAMRKARPGGGDWADVARRTPAPLLVSRRHRSRKVGRLNRNHLVHSGAGPGESFGWHAVHGALVSSCAITHVVALGFARPLKCSDLMASAAD